MGVRSVVCMLVASGVIATASLSAQTAPSTPPSPRAPSKPAAPASPARPPAPPAAPERRPDPSDGGQAVNIKVELSFLQPPDPATPATPKAVAVISADRQLSQVRSAFDDRNTLNLDVRPTLVDGRIRLMLTMEIVPRGGAPNNPFGSNGRLSMVVFLENGKPMTVAESVDAAGHRNGGVEVKATVLK
jgi:hypothetical protein